MLYQFQTEPLPGIYLRRLNRFVVEVEYQGSVVAAHLPNSGRLTAVLAAGSPCWLRTAASPGRKTGFDLLAVETESGSVLLDSLLPNRLVRTALEQGLLPGLPAFTAIRPEYGHGKSRFDLALFDDTGLVSLVEVKSAADHDGEIASFPDAPSLRAAKHMHELTAAALTGQQAAVIFLAQMQWARGVRLSEHIDPLFVQAAREAQTAGVKLFAYTVLPRLPHGVDWGDAIPVLLA